MSSKHIKEIMKKRRCEECVHVTNEISTFLPPTITTENDTALYIFQNKTFKNHRKKIENTSFPKTLLNITFATHGLDLRTTPDDQNHNKKPPEPSPDTPREPSVPCSPRTPWGRLRTPQGPPGTPKGQARKHQGPPRTTKGRTRIPKGWQNLQWQETQCLSSQINKSH